MEEDEKVSEVTRWSFFSRCPDRLVTSPFSLPRLKKTVPAMNECAAKETLII